MNVQKLKKINSKLKFKFKFKLKNINLYIRSTLDEVATFYDLFKRESVFSYLFIIIILMVITGLIFLYFEYPKVVAANPDRQMLTSWDKIVTVMYWSIVTIATLGYGDIYPSSNEGRILVIITLYLSVGSVSLFSANLASALTTKKLLERLKGKGISMLQKQKGLFVICGWKKDMASLIKNIISITPNLQTEDIVIITDVAEEEINRFKNQTELSKINFIQGAYHNETSLRSVNLLDSRKIMILADCLGNETEVDAKTVMTVITAKAIAPNAYVCAEILNKNYENYLKLVNCDEIILSKEYSRALVANAASSAGVAHIIQDLLNPHSGSFLITKEIPEEFIGAQFIKLHEYYDNNTTDILIGILENTGTIFDMKKLAIKEAQKMADMSKLVDNLHKIKKLEGNKPHLNPPNDYVIQRNSLAVFISRVS
ncbi:MAG: NAD-binding protein [Oligoflexia bacterium]|nr:NAD-binding protein [Oligoflexia bacterium]